MNELEVRIVRLEPMRVASAQGFGQNPEEIAWSKKITAAHEEASKAGKGVIVVDGKLVENLHVENAKRVVGLAAMIVEMEAMAG